MNKKKLIFAIIILIVFLILINYGYLKFIEDKDWKYPGFDQFKNNFYQKQSQINIKNTKNLEIKWNWEIPIRSKPIDKENNAVKGSWTGPLIIDGIVYTVTFDNQFFALDSKKGNIICRNEVPKEKIDKRFRYSTRGITYYNQNILMMAADCSIYAFDSKSCDIKWILPSTCENIPGNLGYYFGMNPPLIYKDYIIVVNGGGVLGMRGFVAAYNLTKKDLLWRWYTIPPAVEGPKNWHLEAHKGNIKPYKNDWGNSSEIGGGGVWNWPAIDTEENILFFGTGNPTPDLNASTRPGPNLYTDSVVALNISNGKMIWYYQVTSHDVYDHDIGLSTIFEEIILNGKKEKVVITGTKSGYVLALNAANGKPIYPPITLSLQLNNINDNNPNANLTLESPENKVVCQSANGGIQSSLGFADDVIYAVAQNQCQKLVATAITTRDRYFAGKTINVGLKENSTLYAIDASTGKNLWSFFMNTTYRKGSATISGNLVLLGTDQGYIYVLDKNKGDLLFELNIGSKIEAPITVGADSEGKMKIFVPFGGRVTGEKENGILALGLKENKFLNRLLISLVFIVFLLFIGIMLYIKIQKKGKNKNKRLRD